MLELKANQYKDEDETIEAKLVIEGTTRTGGFKVTSNFDGDLFEVQW